MLQPKYVVLEKVNGHFESIGVHLPALDTEAAAQTKADELARKYRGRIYAWFRLAGTSETQSDIKRTAVAECA